MRPNAVKQKLRDGQPSLGTWLSLGNVLASRFMARAGFDWLTVDLEHSSANIESAAAMFGAVADAGCLALARVPSNRHDHIKRVLDGGAMGVVVPMVMNRAEAEAAVAACRYPPLGNRSVGGSTPALNFRTSALEYFAKADSHLLVVLQCEHIQAARNFEHIYSVPGIDVVFVGPNDLAASMRQPDGTPPSADAFEQVLSTVRAECKKLGLAAGIHCADAAEARQRLDEGWQFLAIGSELKMMLDGAAATLQPLLGGAGNTMANY